MEKCPAQLIGKAGSRLGLIVRSYERLTGESLIGEKLRREDDDLTGALWQAPRFIAAHGTEPDPLFFFGNRIALELFEMTPETFLATPSRLSAEADLREERALLLARVARDNFIRDYSGVRVSSTGKRFRIEQAVVWNLVDAAGTIHGQAASFTHWTRLIA